MRDGANHDVFKILYFLLKGLVVAVKNKAGLIENVANLEEKLKMDLFAIKINDRGMNKKSHFFISYHFRL